MRQPATLFLLCIALSACSFTNDIKAAQMKVAHFHGLLNAGNFDQIAAEADPGMRWPRRGPSFRDYLLSVHRKLGFCGTWRMISFNEQLGLGGGIRINADTHCDADNAQESFVFSSRDLRLRGYAVSSRALVVS
jgi:hypothetical protein